MLQINAVFYELQATLTFWMSFLSYDQINASLLNKTINLFEKK